MPKRYDFREIAELLNSNRTVSINPEPVLGRAGKWGLYHGEYRVHVSRVTFEILYLHADATHDSMQEADRQAFTPKRTQVVYANSLDDRKLRYHAELFSSRAAGFWTTKQYLESFIRDEVESYLQRIKSLEPPLYIDPQVETPAGTKGKIPNPLLGYLKHPYSEQGTNGIAVLLGSPGQGKTYMCQYLVSSLAKSAFIPIYISSTQWNSMSREHLGSLPRTIAHSFRHYDAAIGWIDGQEEQFLRATLQADLFRIVFDGFDEYILRNDGRVTVREALDEIISLAGETGARVLITSRTSFWDSNVDTDDFQQTSHSSVYRICAFDQQHARNYFARRFSKDKTHTDRATALYSQLSISDPEFVGRGFVLKLVGDLVAEAGESLTALPTGAAAMEWLVEALCEREAVRQSLALSARDQVAVFKQFAADQAMGEEPTTDLLEYAIATEVPRLSATARAECLDRLTPHPLLTFGRDGNWFWTQEQVKFLLLSQWLIEGAMQADQSAIARFLQRNVLAQGERNDLAAMIVEVAPTAGKGTREDVVDAIIKAVRRGGSYSASEGPVRDGRALVSGIVLRSVDRILPHSSPHRDRAALFVKLCQGPPIVGVPFSGTIARMDLSGLSFQRCRFDHVMWASNRFSAGTKFCECHFSGGQVEHCEHFGAAMFENCTWDQDAGALIRNEQVREGRRGYTSDDLKADIKSVVDKFIVAGGVSFRTVNAVNLKKGAIRGSRYADQVVSALVGKVLEVHRISGISDNGLNVRSNAVEAFRFYASNGVFTGPLKDVYEELRSRMALE
jgi:hypothetical protein